eukprot:5056297-Alexandrium_andersonii.AAC.1
MQALGDHYARHFGDCAQLNSHRRYDEAFEAEISEVAQELGARHVDVDKEAYWAPPTPNQLRQAARKC